MSVNFETILQAWLKQVTENSNFNELYTEAQAAPRMQEIAPYG